MYKRFLLILAVCGLPVGLWPNAPQSEQPAFGGGNPFGDLNMDEGPYYDDLMYEAREIRENLNRRPEYNQDLITRLDNMIKDLETQEDEETIKAYGYHLRRYEKLGRLCIKEKFDEKKYLELRKLLDQREELVQQILQHYVTLAFAQKTHGDLPNLVRSPLTEERKAAYENEYQDVCSREYNAIQKLQKELEPIEKKLLADHRTFGEKYGVVLGVTGFCVVFFGGILLTANLLHSQFTKKGQENDQLQAATNSSMKARTGTGRSS